MQSLRTTKYVTGHAGSFTQCISMQSLMLHVHGAADSDRACVCNEWLRRHKLVPDLGTVSEAAWQPEHELQTSHILDSAVSHEEHWRGQKLYSSRETVKLSWRGGIFVRAATVIDATNAAVAICSLF